MCKGLLGLADDTAYLVKYRIDMPQIISVGSGKGGVGKSFVTSNLGVLLARAGYSVVMADMDFGGADLHILFGRFKPKHTLTDFLNRDVDELQDVLLPIESCEGLSLLAGTGETLATANPAYATKQRLARHLRKLDADIVILDIGAGTNLHCLDFFLMADLHLLVTNPDPTAVFDAYKFIKLAAIRRVLSQFMSRSDIGRQLAKNDYHSVDEILQAAGENNPESRELAEAVLRDFYPMLIVNRVGQARGSFDALQLRTVLKRYVGSDLEMLGEVPEDDKVVASVRSYLPVCFDGSGSKAVGALQKIARAITSRMRKKAA